jgi:hypothetical protein
MANILSAASITDENLRRNIVLELSHLKNKFKKFRDIIEVYDSKVDPKDLSLSQRPNVISFKFSDYLKYCSLIVIAAILSLIYIKNPFAIIFSELEITKDLYLSLQSAYYSNALVLGIILVFFSFTLTYIARNYPYDILDYFIKDAYRLFLIIVLVIFTILPLFAGLDFFQENKQFFFTVGQLLPFFGFMVFIFLFYNLVSSIKPKKLIEKYSDTMRPKYCKLAKKAGEISHKMIAYRNKEITLRHVYKEMTPNLARNRFSIRASKHGIISKIDLDYLTKIDRILIDHNEAKYAKNRTFLASEIGINKMIGLEVTKEETVATIYTDDTYLVRRLEKERINSKLFSIKHDKLSHNFTNFLAIQLRIFKNALQNNNIDLCKFIIKCYKNMIENIVREKARKIFTQTRIVRKGSKEKFTLLSKNEATFLENSIFKHLFEIAYEVTAKRHHELENFTLELYYDIFNMADKYQLYTIVDIMLSYINKLQDNFFEKKDYDTIINVMYVKTKLAESFYNLKQELSDENLRYSFFLNIKKLVKLSRDDHTMTESLNEVFFNYEILLRIIVVSRYLYRKKVMESLIELLSLSGEELSSSTMDAHQSRYTILLIMRTIFFVGLQSFVSGRYTIAYNAALILINIETKGPIKFKTFFKYIQAHLNRFQLVNELYANLFIPSAMEENVFNFIAFIRNLQNTN